MTLERLDRVRQILRFLPRLLLLVWSASPAYVAVAAVVTVLGAAVGPTQVWISKLIIDRTAEVLQAQNPTVPTSHLLAPVGWLLSVWLVGAVCETLTGHLQMLAASQASKEIQFRILKNGQYAYPEVEGPDSMARVADCEAAVFLVAEIESRPRGFIKAVYDGSRAMIHLLSVHPETQSQGIGKALIESVEQEFARLGVSSVSVTATEQSAAYWEKSGFEKLPVFLMLKPLDS